MSRNWRASMLIALFLGLLLAPALFAGQRADTGVVPINYQRGNNPWPEFFQTTSQYWADLKLTNQVAGGARLLTPGVDPTDLPNSVLVCPGNLQISAQPDGKLDVSSPLFFAGHSAYPGKAPAPAGPAQALSAGQVQWNGPAVIPCGGAANGELLFCMSKVTDVSNAQPFWPQIPTPAKVNVDYAPNLGNPPPPPIFVNMPAEAGMVCTGSVNINGNANRIIPTGGAVAALGANPIQSPVIAVAATTTIPTTVSVSACVPTIHKLPENNNAFSHKYNYVINKLAQPPVTSPAANYVVTVGNPTTCNAVIQSSNPASIAGIKNGQSMVMTLTVQNPQNNIFIQANSVTLDPVSLAAGWKIAEANPPGRSPPAASPGNGFGIPIAPLGQQPNPLPIMVNLTAPNAGSVLGPVTVILNFNSSTPMCTGVVCTSQASFTWSPPPCGCALTSTDAGGNPTTNVAPGNDLTIAAACQCNGIPQACPALAWTTGFAKVDLKALPLPLPPPPVKRTTNADRPSTDGTGGTGPAYLQNANTNPPDPQQTILQTFAWTPVPQTGTVTAGGTLNGKAFTCNVNGANGITINTLPDLIPRVSFVPSPVVPRGGSVTVRVHTTNQGAGATLVNTITDSYMPSVGINPIIHETVLPLASGASTTDQTFSYSCTTPGLIAGISTADVTKAVVESNEANNVVKWVINCGNVLACPDYV